MYQFHFQLTLIKERGERARSTDKNPTKPWTNPVIPLLAANLALAVSKGPSPVPPLHSASVPMSGVVGNAFIFHRTMGGESVNLPPLGAVWTQRSDAMDVACAPPCTTEVTPILALSAMSMPQGIGNGTSAANPCLHQCSGPCWLRQRRQRRQ